MEKLKEKSRDAQVREMKKGETLVFPVNVSRCLYGSIDRAKDHLACEGEFPEYRLYKDRPNKIVTIKRIL